MTATSCWLTLPSFSNRHIRPPKLTEFSIADG